MSANNWTSKRTTEALIAVLKTDESRVLGALGAGKASEDDLGVIAEWEDAARQLASRARNLPKK